MGQVLHYRKACQFLPPGSLISLDSPYRKTPSDIHKNDIAFPVFIAELFAGMKVWKHPGVHQYEIHELNLHVVESEGERAVGDQHWLQTECLFIKMEERSKQTHEMVSRCLESGKLSTCWLECKESHRVPSTSSHTHGHCVPPIPTYAGRQIFFKYEF